MQTAITGLAVAVAIAACSYAWYLHQLPRLPYMEPHKEFDSGGLPCAAWRVEQFVVILCEGRVAVLYPGDPPDYSS